MWAASADGDFLVFAEFLEPLPQFLQLNIDRTVHMAGGMLFGRTSTTVTSPSRTSV